MKKTEEQEREEFLAWEKRMKAMNAHIPQYAAND